MKPLIERALERIEYNSTILFPESSLQKIFVTVYLEKEPVSIKEISKRTGLSLASVSMKANELVRFGVIQKHTKPKSRQLYLKTKHSLVDVMRIHTNHKIETLQEQLASLQTMKQDSTLTAHEASNVRMMTRDLKTVIKAHERMRAELETKSTESKR